MLPSAPATELIAEPIVHDPRTRRRFFTYLQKWRRWLCQQLSRSNGGSKDLVHRGVDDLLSLAFLVQFVRDRKADAVLSLDDLVSRQASCSLGKLCAELQTAASANVLKAIFQPDQFACECALPAAALKSAFWNPIIRANRRIYGRRLPVTIFGDLHQWCLAFEPAEGLGHKRSARSETRRYDKGIHYTPAALVNYLTSRVLRGGFDGLGPEQALERRILDPSCGCGVFLVAALRFLFAWFEAKQSSADVHRESPGLSLQDRLTMVERMIFGSDLDVVAVEWTVRSLLLTAWEGLGWHDKQTTDEPLATVPDLRRNIVARDFLAPVAVDSGELPFSGIANADIILGGPPFVRFKQMLRSDPAAVARYKREFWSARSGQFDLYILFLEKAIDLLAPNGWLGFSVSNTFLRSDTGRLLRRLIGEICQVHEIVEFEDPKIYQDAVIQIALVLLQRTTECREGRHVWIRGKGQLQQKLSALASGSWHTSVETRPLPPEVIRSDQWFFQSAEETDLLAKLQAIGKPLSHLPIHIGQGVVTGADAVFLLRNLQREKDGKILVEQRKTGRRLWVESALLRPIIRNRDIHGYEQPTPSTLCLVPYDASGTVLNEDTLRSDFPQAHHYLLSCKDSLMVRHRQQPGAWYAFSSVAAFRFSGHTKVIGGLITSGGDMTIHSAPTVLCHSGVLMMTPNPLIIDPYYLLGVCNSKVFWAFARHRMPTMGVGRHTIRLGRLRHFPLVEPDTQNQSLVNDIASEARKLVLDPCAVAEALSHQERD